MQLACRVLHVAESGYYVWHNRPPSNRLVKHAWLTEAIAGIHTASRGTYGSRRVHAELGLGLRIHVSHGTVELLMQRAGLHGLPGNRRPRAKHVAPSVADLVERNFTRHARDQLWVTDITEHPTLKARCTARSSWTRSRDAWWAGRSTPRPDHQRPGHGHRKPLPAAGRHHHPLGPRSAVRVLGIHPTRESLRLAALDGLHRGLRGQRDDGVLLGPGPGRTTQPQTVAPGWSCPPHSSSTWRSSTTDNADTPHWACSARWSTNSAPR